MNEQPQIVTMKIASGGGDGRKFFHQSVFFFTREHCQGVSSGEYGLPLDVRWVACSIRIGGMVEPLPGLEDGVVDTIDKMIFAFRSYDQLIPNPSPEYEVPELYARYSMLHNNTAPVARPKNYNRREYPGRSVLTDVQRQILALWEPEQLLSDKTLRRIYEHHIRRV